MLESLSHRTIQENGYVHFKVCQIDPHYVGDTAIQIN